MGFFYCCCDIDLIKVAKVITVLEIILSIMNSNPKLVACTIDKIQQNVLRVVESHVIERIQDEASFLFALLLGLNIGDAIIIFDGLDANAAA